MRLLADRFNVARMGEPTWNDNVLAFGIVLKEVVKSCGLIACPSSTMLPRANRKLENFIQTWCGMMEVRQVFNSQ